MFGKNTLILAGLGAIVALLEPEERRRIGAFVQRGGSEPAARLGLVHRLPKEAMDVLEDAVMPVVRERLFQLGLAAEAMAFNLPHIPVMCGPAGVKAGALLKAVAPVGRVFKARLGGAHLLRDHAGDDAPWRLAFDVTGDEALATSHRDIASGFGLNVPAAVCPVVFSDRGTAGEVRAALLALTAQIDGIVADGIVAPLRDMSVVEFGPAGNVVREYFRASLEDGRIWNVTTGREVEMTGR